MAGEKCNCGKLGRCDFQGPATRLTLEVIEDFGDPGAPSGSQGSEPLRSPVRSSVSDAQLRRDRVGPGARNALAIWRTRSIGTVSLGTTKASNALSQTFAQPNLPTLAL